LLDILSIFNNNEVSNFMAATSVDIVDNDLVQQISWDLYHLIRTMDIRNMVSFLKENAQSNPKQLKAAIISNEMILPCIIELRSLSYDKDNVFYELFLASQNEDTENSEQYVQWLPAEMVNEVLDFLSDKRVLLRLLIENGLEKNIRRNANKCYREGNAPLHEAINRNADPSIVEMLISCGAIVDVQNAIGETPLDIAIHSNKDPSIVHLLLEKSTDASRWPTLYYAVDHGDAILLQLLLDKGADINVRNFSKQTPLHSAIYKGNKEIVEILLQNRADITGKDFWGDTPLHLAVRGNSKEIVKLLLNNGAEVNIQNNEGKNPLDYAREYGDQKLVDLFEKYASKQHGSEAPLSRSLPLNLYTFHNLSNDSQVSVANPTDSPSNSSRLGR
jgi:ankyrin repeat protein